MDNRDRTGTGGVDRDPTLSGASTRATTGAAPAVEHYGQDSKGQESGGMNTEQMKDRAGQAANQVRDKASEMTGQATEAVDARRGQAADTMHTAADQLRERGESLPGGERTTEMATMAADKMEATSTYLREHDVQDMMSDLETMVRDHPKESLIVAAAAGFLVGRVLRG